MRGRCSRAWASRTALQLPPGKLADQLALEFLHARLRQHAAGGELFGAAAGEADEFFDGQRERGVEGETLRHVAHLRQDLAHRLAKEADLALEGEQAEDRFQQGGLSRAVGPDHGDDRLFFDGEADMLERRAAGEAHGRGP